MDVFVFLCRSFEDHNKVLGYQELLESKAMGGKIRKDQNEHKEEEEEVFRPIQLPLYYGYFLKKRLWMTGNWNVGRQGRGAVTIYQVTPLTRHAVGAAL